MRPLDRRKIGALWPRTARSGATFHSGVLDIDAIKAALEAGDTRLVLFSVKNKRDRGPDLELFAVPEQRPSIRATSPSVATKAAPMPLEPITAPPGILEDDNEFPF